MATKKILFLCMGNICRSPAAHCLFQKMVDDAGLSKDYLIDSAGTISFHEGNEPDLRMQEVLRKNKIPIIGRSRALKLEDLEFFDRILAMDKANLADAKALDATAQWHPKIELFANYCLDPSLTEIPDPYYGYADGFEYVLDLIQGGCESLLNSLINE